MATTEHTINDALAGVLRETRCAWLAADVVSSENTGMLRSSSGQPDILVTEANVSPVAIETKVLPAVTVELDAVARLGQQVRTMICTAKVAGQYRHEDMARSYDRISIVTVREIVEGGQRLDIPMSLEVLSAAQRDENTHQIALF